MNRRIELLAERRLQVPEREIRMLALYRERLLCSGQEESFHIESASASASEPGR
jgi:hypothetical protein